MPHHWFWWWRFLKKIVRWGGHTPLPMPPSPLWETLACQITILPSNFINHVRGPLEFTVTPEIHLEPTPKLRIKTSCPLLNSLILLFCALQIMLLRFFSMLFDKLGFMMSRAVRSLLPNSNSAGVELVAK